MRFAAMRAIELTTLIIIYIFLNKMFGAEHSGGQLGVQDSLFLIGVGVVCVTIRLWDVGTKGFSERISARRILVAVKWPLIFIAVLVGVVGALLMTR